MRTFLLIWFGQMISLIGSSLTGFGLGVWVYQRTGSATAFALIGVAATLPGIILAPIAGAVVDRYDRRLIMILSDLCAGLSTVMVALLLFSSTLQIWHIIITSMISSGASAFQNPAYSASISQLVPKAQYGRAAGLVNAAQGASMIVAPALAGVLLGIIGLPGIIAVDFVTFLFAVSTQIFVRFPAYRRTTPAPESKSTSLLQEAHYGWHFITSRRGLFALILFFTFVNFTHAVVGQLLTPMVLSFASPEGLGLIVSTSGIGMLVGSALLATWSSPGRRMRVIFGFGVVQALTMIGTGWHESIVLLALARFAALLGLTVASGVLQVLLQRKVPADVQGRVFSVTRMLTWASLPLAYLLSGPLADEVFQPIMAENGALANSIGQMIGTGAGRGIALMYIVFGIVTLLGTVGACLYSPLRNIERDLPDMTPDDPALFTPTEEAIFATTPEYAPA